MKIATILLILVSISQTIKAQEKKFIKAVDYKVAIDSIFLFINKKNTKKQSSIGLIVKIQKKSTKKIVVDTCFFSNSIAKNPSSSFQTKVSVKKLKNNTQQYQLIHSRACHQSYKSSKYSILLEGYFKMFDRTKPYYRIDEPDLYDSHEGDFCLTNTTSYSLSDSFTNAEGWFSNGLKNGKWLFSNYFFAKTEEQYKNGLRDGLYTVYNKKDSIVYQTTFVKGTGVEKYYYANGNPYSIQYYKNGLIDSSKTSTIYYKNNTIALKENYLKGITTHYYSNGTIFSTTRIKKINNGAQQYQFYKGYTRKGKLKEEKQYINNQLIYTIKYNNKQKMEKITTGNLIQHIKRGKLKEIIFEEY